MFLNGYFYWSGVVANGLVLFWLIVGLCVVAKQWREERKIRKKYAKREVGEVNKKK